MGVISHGNNPGGRLPHGPHQLSPEDVAANQRTRLIDAMVWLIATKGYVATSVSDLIDQATVSRKTFYELFPDRQALVKAAFELCTDATFQEVKTASERSGGPTLQLEAFMRRLCRNAGKHPGMITLCTAEIATAHAGGFELRETLMSRYAGLIQDCLSPDGERPVPHSLAITLAGAVHREIDANLSAGRLLKLTDLSPQLARWIRSYHPVPTGLHIDGDTIKPHPGIGLDGLVGGRAPGTLTLAPEGYLQRVARPSPAFLAHTNRERILDAVAQLNAEHGYSELSVEAIAEHADLSERTFRAIFKNRDEAFAAAVELGHTKGQAIVERTRGGTSLWRDGVRNSIRALLEFLASEPYFTRLAFVDARLAGPAMARRSNEHAAAYARLVFDGAPQRRHPPPIVPEAIVHGLFELAYRHAAEDRTGELPGAAQQAIYLALAPFLGVTAAAEAASGS
jgi:AcrR family transcriptional regulator